MATPQALTAVIRASRPEFKSIADKVAFAVHAVLSVNGFSLRIVGEGVDEAAAQGASALPPEEADLAGWDADAAADGGTYSFLYVPEPGAQRQQQQASTTPPPTPLLLVKCLRLEGRAARSAPTPVPTVGDAGKAALGGASQTAQPQQQQSSGYGIGGSGVLLVSLADVASGRPPASLELQLDRYAPSLAPGAGGYEHLDELIQRVEGALAGALDGAQQRQQATKAQASGATAAATSATKAGGEGAREGGGSRQRDPQREAQEAAQEEEEEERRRRTDPLRDDRYRLGPPTRGPPGWGPSGVGDEDWMPGGLPRPPGLGGGLGGPLGPGGGLLGPRGLGGGMHVGPENPIFADRLRHPRGGGPGYPPGLVPGGPAGGVPGMRWDPIAPEGLQGWSPDDYTREGRAQRGEGFNDIGRPPPGRGPDWDNMFG